MYDPTQNGQMTTEPETSDVKSTQAIGTQEKPSLKEADKLFNEAAIEAALHKAGPYAKQRFTEKTSKIKWRAAKWVPENKKLGTPGHVAKQPLPCADLTRYIENFIITFAPEYKEKMYE